MHCAVGNNVGTGWIAFMVSGRDILDDADFHDRMNGRLADRTQAVTKDEVLGARAHHRSRDPLRRLAHGRRAGPDGEFRDLAA